MYCIVGLGNPGPEYEETRHNAGRLVLNSVIEAERLPTPVKSAKYNGQFSEGVIAGVEVKILFPETFMNQSGGAVKKFCAGSLVTDLIVIYDDVDVALGELKVSFGRGDGGHNGLKSIIESLESKDFIRVRVGIAPKGMMEAVERPESDKLAKYVLGRFTKRELEELKAMGPVVGEALGVIVSEGYEKAMNRYN